MHFWNYLMKFKMQIFYYSDKIPIVVIIYGNYSKTYLDQF